MILSTAQNLPAEASLSSAALRSKLGATTAQCTGSEDRA